MTNHPKDAHISDSASGGKGESMAKEIRKASVSELEAMAKIKRLIRFYEKQGWSWLIAAEYLIRSANGTWPHSCSSFGRRRH